MTYRIVFFGTPDFSVPTLAEIIDAGHEVKAVYTQPPRPGGRGNKVRQSPVHLFADQHDIPVYTPQSLKTPEVQAKFRSHQADIAIIIAYGLMLPKPILDMPIHGCWNLHASLLPRWRGAAPIQRAIMAGDSETGIMVMRMEEGLDTGPVCSVEKTSISPDMIAGELHDILAESGAKLMLKALSDFGNGTLTFVTQSECGVTYASKISKSETRINWFESAGNIHNHIRGLSPFPGAWFEASLNGRLERIKVLRSTLEPGDFCDRSVGEMVGGELSVVCGEGAVRLNSLQRAGRKPISAKEFLRGMPLRSDDIILGS